MSFAGNIYIINTIIINVNRMPVDYAFSIQNPLPWLANCRNTITTTPIPAHKKAALLDGRLEKRPNSNGAVSETDIRE